MATAHDEVKVAKAKRLFERIQRRGRQANAHDHEYFHQDDHVAPPHESTVTAASALLPLELSDTEQEEFREIQLKSVSFISARGLYCLLT